MPGLTRHPCGRHADAKAGLDCGWTTARTRSGSAMTCSSPRRFRLQLLRRLVPLHLLESLHEVVAGMDPLVLRRVLGRLELRQAFHRRVVVQVEEGRDGIALLARAVRHAVQVGYVVLVG